EKLKEKLKEAMLAAAKELNFERATMLRDKMLAVKIKDLPQSH
ncbi:MAG TPA: UvrB/UvrC motif-containing protein, partial [Leptospiraceae bacterium]|nr:UvrB/UvrC motif-containing protein [Leptospiraceae bacterium]